MGQANCHWRDYLFDSQLTVETRSLIVNTVETQNLTVKYCRDSRSDIYFLFETLRTPNLPIMNLTILASLCLLALVSTAPQSRNFRGWSRNSNNNPNTRFFTGNRPLDDAIVGASLGLATQYIANNIFNPCRNRNNNRGTNNRIFNSNGILGFIGGFAAGQAINNAQGNPCG